MQEPLLLCLWRSEADPTEAANKRRWFELRRKERGDSHSRPEMADAVHGTLPTCCRKKNQKNKIVCRDVTLFFLKQVYYWASKNHSLAGIASVPTHDTHTRALTRFSEGKGEF